MIEGSGFVSLTNGSGSGGPKNIRYGFYGSRFATLVFTVKFLLGFPLYTSFYFLSTNTIWFVGTNPFHNCQCTHIKRYSGYTFALLKLICVFRIFARILLNVVFLYRCAMVVRKNIPLHLSYSLFLLLFDIHQALFTAEKLMCVWCVILIFSGPFSYHCNSQRMLRLCSRGCRSAHLPPRFQKQ